MKVAHNIRRGYVSPAVAEVQRSLVPGRTGENLSLPDRSDYDSRHDNREGQLAVRIDHSFRYLRATCAAGGARLVSGGIAMTKRSNDPTQVAVVGCGRILPRYFPHLLSWPGLAIAAWTDLVEERAAAAAREYGAGKARSLADVLNDPSIDVIFNLTPAINHSDVSEAAIRLGKSVYSEAPLAMDAQVASKLVDLATRQGVRIGAGPDVFLGEVMQRARALIEQGAIGVPRTAFATFCGAGEPDRVSDPSFPGTLAEAGVHHLTALVALLGRVVSVAGMSRDFFSRVLQFIPVHSANTHFSASLCFENDVLATLLVGFALGPSRYPGVEIHGTEGTILLPLPHQFGGDLQLWRKGAEAPASESPRGSGPHPGWDRPGMGLADFVEAIRADRPHQASADLAFHVQEIMTRIDESGPRGSVREIHSSPGRIHPGHIAEVRQWCGSGDVTSAAAMTASARDTSSGCSTA
jgi:predicted dehydrogenase